MCLEKLPACCHQMVREEETDRKSLPNDQESCKVVTSYHVLGEPVAVSTSSDKGSHCHGVTIGVDVSPHCQAVSQITRLSYVLPGCHLRVLREAVSMSQSDLKDQIKPRMDAWCKGKQVSSSHCHSHCQAVNITARLLSSLPGCHHHCQAVTTCERTCSECPLFVAYICAKCCTARFDSCWSIDISRCLSCLRNPSRCLVSVLFHLSPAVHAST